MRSSPRRFPPRGAAADWDRTCRDEHGISVVEYVLLVAIGALALIVCLLPLGHRVLALYAADSSGALARALQPPPSQALTTPRPTFTLTESVAGEGALTMNVLSGLNPPTGTLTAAQRASGGGILTWSSNGVIHFMAPKGKDVTVIRFAYTQNGVSVTGNTLTIVTV